MHCMLLGSRRRMQNHILTYSKPKRVNRCQFGIPSEGWGRGGGVGVAGGMFCVDDPQLKGRGRRGRRGRKRMPIPSHAEWLEMDRNPFHRQSNAHACMATASRNPPHFPTPTLFSPLLSFRPYVLVFVLRPWFVSKTAFQSMLLIVDRFYILVDSGGVVNSLDFCPASLKSLGCFYFRCVLS